MVQKAARATAQQWPDVAHLLHGSIGVRGVSRILATFQGHQLGEIFVIQHAPTLAERISGRFPLIDGAAVIGHGSPHQFAGLLPANARPELPERFAHLHYLALYPTARGQGKSTLLIAAALRWALKNEYRYLVAGSWYSGVSRSSGDLLSAAGARTVGVVPMAALSPQRDCPKCGEACDCSAVVYVRQIDEQALAAWLGARRQNR